MKLFERFVEITDALITITMLFIVGAAIGLAQALGSAERTSFRLAAAKAITTGGLAVGAASVVVWLPDTSLHGQIGLAAVIGSLGTSGLERLFARVLGGR